MRSPAQHKMGQALHGAVVTILACYIPWVHIHVYMWVWLGLWPVSNGLKYKLEVPLATPVYKLKSNI